MDTIEIENISFELRKINAIKIRKITRNDSNEKMNDEKSNEPHYKHNLTVDLTQSSDNKKKFEVFLFYRIPSIQEYDILIDAEFFAEILLKEPFDLEAISEDEDEDNFSNLADKFMPRLFKEIDKILSPIFKSMNAKYYSTDK